MLEGFRSVVFSAVFFCVFVTGRACFFDAVLLFFATRSFFAALLAAFTSDFGMASPCCRTTPPWPQQEKCPTEALLPSLHVILLDCADSVEAASVSRPATTSVFRSDFMGSLMRASEPVPRANGYPQDDWRAVGDTVAMRDPHHAACVPLKSATFRVRKA